jgi:DNA anti-recombination protein RmuC
MEFTFQRGPDGKRYAVGGEVSIDVSKIPGDPQATLDKADQVRRAALAPAEPSAQDRRVASLATQISLEAQNEIRQVDRMEAEKAAEERAERREISEDENEKVESSDQTNEARTQQASEENSERLEEIFEKTSEAIEDALDAAYRQQPQQEIGFNLDTTV